MTTRPALAAALQLLGFPALAAARQPAGRGAGILEYDTN